MAESRAAPLARSMRTEIAFRFVRVERHDHVLGLGSQRDRCRRSPRRAEGGGRRDPRGPRVRLSWAGRDRKLVERGFHGPTGEEHVVDEDYGRAVDVGRNLRRRKFLRDGMPADVVAMKRDVERAGARVQLLRRAAARVRRRRWPLRGAGAFWIAVPRRNGSRQPRDRSLNLPGTDRLRCGHQCRL